MEHQIFLRELNMLVGFNSCQYNTYAGRIRTMKLKLTIIHGTVHKMERKNHIQENTSVNYQRNFAKKSTTFCLRRLYLPQ